MGGVQEIYFLGFSVGFPRVSAGECFLDLRSPRRCPEKVMSYRKLLMVRWVYIGLFACSNVNTLKIQTLKTQISHWANSSQME